MFWLRKTVNFQVSGKFQNLWRHILLDNSRGKGKQTMKSGQLIQYNTKNTFFEKSYTKCDEEASLRSIFFKLSISLDQQFEFWHSWFWFLSKSTNTKIHLELRCWSLALSSNKAFLKTKGGLELIFLPKFLHDFWTTILLILFSIYSLNFIFWLPWYFLRYLAMGLL